MGKSYNSKPSHIPPNKCRKKGDLKKLAFIMLVFGLVSICAFFLPVKAWIVLISILLIYCGWKLSKY